MLEAIFNVIEIAAKAFMTVVFVIFFIGVFLIACLLISLPKLDRPKRANKKHWRRARQGRGFGIDELARRLDVSVEKLTTISPDYTERFIEKRSGGSRRLLVPSQELKELQQRILKRLLARLSVHPAATGFEPGTSIVHNATQHTDQSVVICMDVRDFFLQTTADRVTAYFQRIGWNREAAELLAKLTTWESGLPQGAPTSPRLSNLVNLGTVL